MKYTIVYEPRVQDPVVVARFKTREEAEDHMDMIKVNHYRVYQFHKIVEDNSNQNEEKG